MPKIYPARLKARAIALLANGKNATEAATALVLEFPGETITPRAVQSWAKALHMQCPVGRAAGSPATRFSPNKANIVACHDRGLTQAETCRELKLSRSLVSKHWPDPSA